MLYSPFIPQIVMAALYPVLLVVLLALVLLKFRRWTVTVYACMMLVNVALLFSAVLGAGASNYNELKMQCNMSK